MPGDDINSKLFSEKEFVTDSKPKVTVCGLFCAVGAFVLDLHIIVSFICIMDKCIDEAKKQFRRGNYRSAIRWYTRALSKDSTCCEALMGRGQAFHETGKYFDAVDDFSKLIAINPQDAEAWRNRSLAYYNLNMEKEAIRDFGEAMRILGA